MCTKVTQKGRTKLLKKTKESAVKVYKRFTQSSRKAQIKQKTTNTTFVIKKNLKCTDEPKKIEERGPLWFCMALCYSPEFQVSKKGLNKVLRS